MKGRTREKWRLVENERKKKSGKEIRKGGWKRKRESGRRMARGKRWRDGRWDGERDKYNEKTGRRRRNKGSGERTKGRHKGLNERDRWIEKDGISRNGTKQKG